MKKVIVCVLLGIISAGCSVIIPKFITKKEAKLCVKPECMEADKYFWDNLHAGNYDSIPKILDRLKGVYYENPGDYKLLAHIGFTHAWAIAEEEKLENSSASIIDHASLARQYFKDAFELTPEDDWRLYGFYASFIMAEGTIHGNEKQVVEGYFEMKKAVKKYPEFNLFTKAYSIMNGDRRAEAIQDLWKNLDVCVGEKVDRDNLDYRKYQGLKDVESKMSTCWNTWIAPHNLEGFFLIFGDLLLEENDRPRALMMYRNATYTDNFDNWKYKENVLQRISLLENAIAQDKEKAGIMAHDYDACMVCHEEGKIEDSPANVHLNRPAMDLSVHLSK